MKKKSSSGFTSLFLLAAAAGGGFWWWRKKQAAPTAAAAITAKSAPLAASETIIISGTDLPMGKDFWSPDRSCRLVFQPDGNLVLYRANGSVIWSGGSNGATSCFFGTDGHFSASGFSGNPPLKKHYFSSGTNDGRGKTLRVRNSGSVVICDAAGNVIWIAPQGPLEGLSGLRPLRVAR